LNGPLIRKNSKFVIALCSGFLFLVIPSHVEAVTWISDRGDVLATFFALSSFLAYLFYKQYSNLLYSLISLLLCACALFTKESVVVVPIIILFYEFYRSYIKPDKGHKFTTAFTSVLLYPILLILYLISRYFVLGELIGGYGKETHLNFKPLLIVKNLLVYPARVFLPPVRNIELIFIAMTMFTILIIIGMQFIMRKKLPSIIYFLVLAFYISLLPVVNLNINCKDTQGSRFIYFPSVFFIICVVILFYYCLINRRVFVTISVVLILLYRLLLYQVNKNWIEASKISQNILNTIKQLEQSDRLLIISLPDNINGAYIFRNGISKAIKLFIGPGRFKDITVISLYDIFSENDSVKVTKGTNGCNVQILNSKGCFKDVRLDYVSNIACESFYLNFNKMNLNDKVIFYTAGKMEALKL